MSDIELMHEVQFIKEVGSDATRLSNFLARLGAFLAIDNNTDKVSVVVETSQGDIGRKFEVKFQVEEILDVKDGRLN